MTERTHWDRPAHFIAARDCRFGIADVVGDYIVSTVGDYYPLGERARHAIGADRYFETMVFVDSGRRCEEPDCLCGLPEPSDWSEVDFDGYQTADEARAGHELMVAKYGDAAKVRP